MESLKSSLKSKLLELEFEGSGLEALAVGNDSVISVAQFETVDKWHRTWVEAEFEKLKDAIENVPFALTKPKPSLDDDASDEDSDYGEGFHEMYKRLARKIQRTMRRQAIKQLSQKRDMLRLQPTELGLLGSLLYINSENFSIQKNKELMRLEDCIISFKGYQTALKEFSKQLKAQREVECNGIRWLMADSMWMMKWFTAKLFMQLSKPELDGKVHTSSLMEYVYKRVYNYKVRLDFLDFDADGRGYITNNQLGLYLLQNWPCCKDKLDENQVSEVRSFIAYLVTEIFFLLDPNKNGCVRSAELLGWKLFPFARKEFQDNSLFNAFKLKKDVYEKFHKEWTQLFADTFCELFPAIAKYIWENDSRLGNKKVRFLKSYMERLVGYSKMVSYDTFLNITFAWENLGRSFSSIWYFFRGLDTQLKGYLEVEDLECQYQALHEYWEYQGNWENDEQLDNLQQVQVQIHEWMKRKGVSRITPKILHEMPGGYMILEYLINAELLSSPPSLLQDKQK